MAKDKRIFVCNNCGVQSTKWIGKCPSCKEWNTYEEEVIVASKPKSIVPTDNSIPILIGEISTKEKERIKTNCEELDRVLGGGVMPGSVVLIGGEPGIGKSTLLLQVLLNLNNRKSLYISGEESLTQIKLRADRIGVANNDCYIFSETLIENIIPQINKVKPEIIIVDSIQTTHTDKIESTQGGVSQIRECTNLLMQYAKSTSIPIFLVGHINKEGTIAGPKILEHIVDTVLQFEGDQNYMFRILRAMKNRFGSTSEIGIFEMKGSGLNEVKNPSELLLSISNEKLSGTAVASANEGIRPFLIEIQALVSTSAYGTPQRSATGYDVKRLNMLLAVLEKRAGFRLATKDVFLNIAGGLKVKDPSIDLAVICAVLSSDSDTYINNNICFAGEIGLTGEIRPVNRIDQRIKEAEKLGFNQIYISGNNKKNIDVDSFKIKISYVNKVEEISKIILSS